VLKSITCNYLPIELELLEYYWNY